MKLPFAAKKPPTPTSELPLSPRQLYEEAAANVNDYSKKTCLNSLATRKVILSGVTTAPNPEIPSAVQTHELGRGFLSHLLHPFSKRIASRPAPATEASDSSAAAAHGQASLSYAIASVTHAEPCTWEGQKAHFVRLHIEFHPDSEHYLERVDVTIRAWNAGDALKSIESIASTQLLTIQPPQAPELGKNAPSIVLYSPRAVVGRPAGSTTEPYWEGRFRGENFVYFAEAMPPVDCTTPGLRSSTLPRSLLQISAMGNDENWQPAPHFDVALVVLSRGKPFDLTAYSTSLHWGMPAVVRHIFTPYKPAKLTRTTRFIPKGEKGLGDLSTVAARDKLRTMMGWAAAYDTVGCLFAPHCSLLTCGSGSAALWVAWTSLRPRVGIAARTTAEHARRAVSYTTSGVGLRRRRCKDEKLLDGGSCVE